MCAIHGVAVVYAAMSGLLSRPALPCLLCHTLCVLHAISLHIASQVSSKIMGGESKIVNFQKSKYTAVYVDNKGIRMGQCV